MTTEFTPISVRFTPREESTSGWIMSPDWQVNLKHTCKEINLKETHMTEKQLQELIDKTKSRADVDQANVNYHALRISQEIESYKKHRDLLIALEKDLKALKDKEAKND